MQLAELKMGVAMTSSNQHRTLSNVVCGVGIRSKLRQRCVFVAPDRHISPHLLFVLYIHLALYRPRGSLTTVLGPVSLGAMSSRFTWHLVFCPWISRWNTFDIFTDRLGKDANRPPVLMWYGDFVHKGLVGRIPWLSQYVAHVGLGWPLRKAI